jgi:hypothetical protein
MLYSDISVGPPGGSAAKAARDNDMLYSDISVGPPGVAYVAYTQDVRKSVTSLNESVLCVQNYFFFRQSCMSIINVLC